MIPKQYVVKNGLCTTTTCHQCHKQLQSNALETMSQTVHHVCRFCSDQSRQKVDAGRAWMDNSMAGALMEFRTCEK